jgi:transcriptional regulator with XRE-family HTH domain
MTTDRHGATVAAGERLRRTRIATGRSRQSVGDAIGVSASMIGRMERGEGDGVLVRRWVAAADTLGLRLTLALDVDPGRAEALSPAPRVLTAASIQRLASTGGWRVERPGPFRMSLVRDATKERLLVYLCDRTIEILDAADVRIADRATATAALTDGWRLGLLIVVRAELRDRYRPMDWMADELDVFQTTGSQMIAALRGPRVHMPERDVLIWCDDAATRLIPFGLSLEPGRRARRRRPAVRRTACPRGD